MAIPDYRTIIENSPLNSGGKEDVPEYKRKLFFKFEQILKEGRFIHALCGMRRVGKSTLMKQILNTLPNSFYFSFDEKKYLNPEALDEVIKTFIKKGEECTIGLDEIGRIEDWAGILKKYYDSHKITFFISSSSSLLTKRGKESLAGRMLDFHLPPLQFNEFLELKKVKKQKEAIDISEDKSMLRFHDYSEHLKEFLESGSFPQIAFSKNKDLVKKYVENSTVEKMIFEDIPQTFGVEHPAKLEQIFRYASEYSGDLFHETAIASSVSLNHSTVTSYLNYMYYSGLIRVLHEEGSYSKALRKYKKLFVTSPALYYNTCKNFSSGKLYETAVLDKLSAVLEEEIFFYRDYQQHEVDFVAGKIPIEVKLGKEILLNQLQGLKFYIKEKKPKKALVIYSGEWNKIEMNGTDIFFIPFHMLLSCDEIKL